MEEIIIKLDVPRELSGKFEAALEKVIEQFVRRVRFAMVDEIMSQSNLTEQQVTEMSSRAKEKAAKRHG